MNGYVSLISSMGIDLTKIRGFSTNVANYQSIGKMCPWQSSDGVRNDYCLNNQHQTDECCSDPCKLETQWNPANNELNYVNGLYHAFVAHQPNFQPFFIIDTGRNGVANMRSDCSNWCNIRNAGIGLRPSYLTASTIVDAYHWLKTPGESDGCTQTLPNGGKCARYDAMCGSQDSLGSKNGEPYAPEAGQWFDYQIKQLAYYGI
jgi:cellulase/cellobiase CelA1